MAAEWRNAVIENSTPELEKEIKEIINKDLKTPIPLDSPRWKRRRRQEFIEVKILIDDNEYNEEIT